MKVNIKVRDNYKSYCSLIDEEKILLNNKIKDRVLNRS